MFKFDSTKIVERNEIAKKIPEFLPGYLKISQFLINERLYNDRTIIFELNESSAQLVFS